MIEQEALLKGSKLLLCEDCGDDSYKIPLWQEVNEFHSWLTSTSEKLSDFGKALHHSDQSQETSREVVNSSFKVIEAEASRRKPFVEELLSLARKHLSNAPEEQINCASEADGRASLALGIKYDTKDNLRSTWNNKWERDCTFSNLNELSSYITEERKELFYSYRQLEFIEQLWKFVRVQIKVLIVQLSTKQKQGSFDFCNKRKEVNLDKNNSTTQGDLQSAIVPLGNVAEIINCSSTTNSASVDTEECYKKYHSSSARSKDQSFQLAENSTEARKEYKGTFDKDLFSCLCKMSKNIEKGSSSKETNRLQPESGNLSNVTSPRSPRDEGYLSRAGESTAEEMSILSDTQSLDADSLLQVTQNTGEGNKPTQNVKKGADSVPVITEDPGDGNCAAECSQEVPENVSSCFSSLEWDQIYNVVERFSQNTMTLHSWMDELEDILLDDTAPSLFYDSILGRKITVKRHIGRVCEDVKEDAAILLKNLVSERATILSVLDKIELRCRRCGICIGDDISELSNIQPVRRASDFLSPRLQNDLAASLTSYEDFKPPLTSTPRDVAECKPASTRCLYPSPRYTDLENYPVKSLEISSFPSRLLRGMCSEEKLISSSSVVMRRNWEEFVSESDSVMEWLQNMDMRIRQTEISALSINEMEAVFERYLHQFGLNKARYECLNIKANYIGTMFPELERDVQTKLSTIDNLWRALKLKLCHFLKPLSLKHLSIEYPPPPYHRWKRTISLSSDTSYARPLTLEEWRQHRPFFGPDVQLSDFSFHQIRDRSDAELGEPLHRRALDRRDDCLRLLSADQLERMRCRAIDRTWDCDILDEPSYYPDLVRSRWREFEGIEGELTHRSRPLRQRWVEPCRPHRPNRNEIPKPEDNVWLTPHKKDAESTFQEEKGSTFKRQKGNRGPWLHKKSTRFLSTPHENETGNSEEEEETNNSKIDEEEPSAHFEEPEYSQLSANPYLLSSRIQEFHYWLKEMEEKTYIGGKTIGWDPKNLYDLIVANKNRLVSLKHRRTSLTRVLSSAENIMRDHTSEVSEFFLLWSSWMLEQRYYNLILYSIDLECIAERRLEVLQKGTNPRGLSHPLDGVWSDRCVDMVASVPTVDDDYLIFAKV